MARAFSALGSIRELTGSEQALHRDHLTRLDPEGRRDRFNGIADDSFIARYSERCFAGVTRVFALVDRDGHVRGTAELHPPVGDEPADIAFSVEPEWRRQGIASELFAAVINAARLAGYARLRITSSSDNHAMRALARKFGARFTFSQGETAGTIEVAPAAPPLAAEREGIPGFARSRALALAGC